MPASTLREAIIILIGECPKHCLAFVQSKVNQGQCVTYAVSAWLLNYA